MRMKNVEWSFVSDLEDKSALLWRKNDPKPWCLYRLKRYAGRDQYLFYFLKTSPSNRLVEVLPRDTAENYTLFEAACLLQDFEPHRPTNT